MVEIHDLKEERERIQRKIREDISRASAADDIIKGVIPAGKEFANREEAERNSPELAELNEKYAFVHSLGGKPMIKTMVFNEYFDREIVEFITPESLQQRYSNRLASETTFDPRKNGVLLGKWWLAHQYRKDYETVTFEPDKPPGEYSVLDPTRVKRKDNSEDKHVLYFNLWEGFKIEPQKGSWQRIKYHIYRILCNGDKSKFKYLIRWLAWAVQNPGKAAEVAVIFKGKKGAGKGFFLQMIVEMYGRHGLVISNKDHLVGKHNQHLSMCSFLFVDEYQGDKEVEGIIKSLITEPSLTTEPKFRDLKITRNCLHIAMATNADWIIPATEDERRYFINEVDNRYAKGQTLDSKREAYFNKIWEERRAGGAQAMLYDLLKMNLTNWHPRNSIPETDELRRQIAMSLPKLKFAFASLLEDGIFPGAKDSKNRYVISNNNLLQYLQNLEINNKTITSKQVAKLCEELGLEKTRSNGARLYIFKELNEMRMYWNEKITRNSDWDLTEKWEVTNQY